MLRDNHWDVKHHEGQCFMCVCRITSVDTHELVRPSFVARSQNPDAVESLIPFCSMKLAFHPEWSDDAAASSFACQCSCQGEKDGIRTRYRRDHIYFVSTCVAQGTDTYNFGLSSIYIYKYMYVLADHCWPSSVKITNVAIPCMYERAQKLYMRLGEATHLVQADAVKYERCQVVARER